jgi:hypothetical protein
MISGEAFWDAYEKFDFAGLESEIRSDTLEAAAKTETRAMGWGLVTLSTAIGEIITGAYAITEQSPKSLGLFALSSLSLAASYLKVRYWGDQANNIPRI